MFAKVRVTTAKLWKSNLKANQYDKVLTIVLTYNVMNEYCSVPLDFKNYINGVKMQNRAFLEKVSLAFENRNYRLPNNTKDQVTKSREPFFISEVRN